MVMALAAVAGAVGVQVADASTAPHTTAAAPLRVMPLGASITHGIGSTTGNGFRAELWNQLLADPSVPIDYVGSQQSGDLADRDNEGHPGWRIEQITANIDAWMDTYSPDVVLVHVGTNDMVQAYQVATAPQRLSDLVERIVARRPGTVVVASSLIASRNADINARISAFNAALPGLMAQKTAAGKLVYFADLHRVVTTAEMSDDIHPNDAGFAKMGALWSSVLKPVLLGRNGVAITSSLNGRCLDVPGSRPADGVTLQMYDCNNSVAQKWTFAADGTVRAMGKCMDPRGAGTANATVIQLWPCTGNPVQKFTLNAAGDLVNVNANRCVDIARRNSQNRATLHLWDCLGLANQKWTRG
jgi:lysophospholipase L1-like esterase